jgi:hypothetical protein
MTDLVCFSEYLGVIDSDLGHGSTTTYLITEDGETARCRSAAS